MIQTEATIVSNETLGPSHWKMILDVPQIASEVKPGQFCHIRIPGALLRRPFSVFRRVDVGPDRGEIEIVYEVVGRGTRAMTALRAENRVDLIGPLGQGFQWKTDHKSHVLVAGGIGAAGLFMLGKELSRYSKERGDDLVIILGAESGHKLILEEEFKTLHGNLMIATEDGSRGHKGLVTEILEHALEEGEISGDCMIYSCGPEPMLKALSLLCKRRNIEAQVSLEKGMLCGIGACFSCVCKVDKGGVLKHRNIACSHIQLDEKEAFGYALVCKDGPVFNLEEVLFDD